MDSEEKIQSEFYIWFHNTYPEYRGLLCYNLNNSRNKIDGARNRALGLQPGRSDMTFYWNGTAHFLELKNEIGVQSTGQKEWEALIVKHGFKYGIFKTVDSLKTYIVNLIGNKPSTT